MVHLNFSTGAENHKAVFGATQELFNELFQATLHDKWEKNGNSIRRVRDNFIIDVDNKESVKKVYELYITVDPLKWKTIIKYLI